MNLKIGYWLLVIGLTVIALLSRLLPHPANFTAIGAIALFSGTYFKHRWGILLPLFLMAVTDAVIGFYEWPVMFAVYGSFAVVGMVGWYIRKYKNIHTMIVGALSVSIIFFVVTNFAVWAATPWYPKTLAGLLMSYELAVPFFRNMLAGDLVYTASLFGCYELFVRVMQKRPHAAVSQFIP